MAVREMATSFEAINAGADAISTNTTTNTAIIDTRDADMGVTFVIVPTAYTDGTYAFNLQEGDESDLSDATNVPTEYFVKNAAEGQTIAAALAENGSAVRIGVHSNKRYLRLQIISTGVTTGATLSTLCLLGREVIPAGISTP